LPALVGPVARIAQVRKTFDHIPPWRCYSFTKGLFFLCGRCFTKLGDGPATSAEEIWMAGTDRTGTQHPEVVPLDARCHDCRGRAWPMD
jgi:hypothetical protein